MGYYFLTPPIIRFHGECYHYETRYHTRTDSQGNIEYYTTEVKVVTYTESYDLPYYSERDVSGLFYLNCEEAYVSKKHYIKLELLEEINLLMPFHILIMKEKKKIFGIEIVLEMFISIFQKIDLFQE